MAEVNAIERRLMEGFFQMGDGYVLDFSDRTFLEFVRESVNRDPYDTKYDIEGRTRSKANRLRGILMKEQNHIVGRLIEDLAKYRCQMEQPFGQGEYESIMRIATRLKSDRIVESIEAITERVEDMDFSILAKEVRERVERNEPQAALDRLHTYTYHFLRNLCDKHEISYTRDDTLNAITGKYIKHLVAKELIETQMTERILKSSISLLDAYNDVRNNRSLAHANKMLNYDESLLIVSNVVNIIRFIQSIETKYDAELRAEQRRKEEEDRIRRRDEIDDLPF
jgi:hypothetical protein